MAGSIDYDAFLNPAQREAVMAGEGPILVIAGAGSGKTRTLVYRVARLVETGVPPEAILLLTFTRKAAQEMLERAAGLSDPRCRLVTGGTFHSLAYRTLRRHAPLLGYERTFSILDRSDMEEALQGLITEVRPVAGGGRFPKRATVANILSKAANVQLGVEALVMEEYPQFLDAVPALERLRGLYAEYKKAHHMMDYDDLILNFRLLLEREPEVREDLAVRYRHLLVDEYQDTNAIQADIVRWLARSHRNVMVVGDDSQSIYSFRGADYRNMFDFTAHFPETRVIKLEENYRSTQPILTLTNALMARAREKYTKCLYTRRVDGETPRLVDTGTEPEQAIFVCRLIEEGLAEGRSLSDFAVLFRAGYHSFELEMELGRKGLPYVKYGGFKFMESAHIKDFLAHMRVVVNRDDVLSWSRILRLVERIGPARSGAIVSWMRESGVPPHEVARWPGEKRSNQGLDRLGRLLARLGEENLAPRAAVEAVMEYYGPILQKKFDDYPRRRREIEQLLPMAGRYRSFRNFLDDLALDPPAGSADLEAKAPGDCLTLSTVHSAKGLEWPVVIIIWLTEGRFPPVKAFAAPEMLEEERRLLYVAATRAKDHLILCYPGRDEQPVWQRASARLRPGLSSFIRDLPHEVLVREYGSTSRASYRPSPPPRIREEPRFMEEGSSETPSPGQRVRHPAFGPGVVSRIVGGDKVEVFFRDFGRKLLHLEHTSLELM
ncbi:MAG: UvrD-helicase domain-containing protein [Deltaproteobacteria bacterium]|nr:UvrD-helicase domain-containing protein [Deltaproteobacteria bacterium]